MTQTMIK